MSTPEIDQQLADEVARLKKMAIHRSTRLNWILAACLIASVLVGLVTWFLQNPMNRDEIMFGGVLGLGGATFFIGCMLARMLIPKPDTKCPKCRYDWQGSDPTDNWLTWNCCPACGLKMSDDIGSHEKPNQGDESRN